MKKQRTPVLAPRPLGVALRGEPEEVEVGFLSRCSFCF